MSLSHINHNSSSDEIYKKEIIDLIHFIRTPLASIKIGSEIMKDTFQILVTNYKSNIRFNGKEKAVISDDKLDKLSSIFESLFLEANKISEYIDKIKIK